MKKNSSESKLDINEIQKRINVINLRGTLNLGGFNLNDDDFYQILDEVENRGLSEKVTLIIANDNKISAIDDDNLSNLVEVKQIHFNNNQISEIKNLNLPSLKTLNLNHNKISEIKNFFDGLENLEILHLDHNLISKIDGLGHLKKLIRLEMDSNKISRIERGDFPASLLHISLLGNQITKIADGAFDELDSECVLKLDNCSEELLAQLLEYKRNQKDAIKIFYNSIELDEININYLKNTISYQTMAMAEELFTINIPNDFIPIIAELDYKSLQDYALTGQDVLRALYYRYEPAKLLKGAIVKFEYLKGDDLISRAYWEGNEDKKNRKLITEMLEQVQIKNKKQIEYIRLLKDSSGSNDYLIFNLDSIKNYPQDIYDFCKKAQLPFSHPTKVFIYQDQENYINDFSIAEIAVITQSQRDFIVSSKTPDFLRYRISDISNLESNLLWNEDHENRALVAFDGDKNIFLDDSYKQLKRLKEFYYQVKDDGATPSQMIELGKIIQYLKKRKGNEFNPWEKLQFSDDRDKQICGRLAEEVGRYIKYYEEKKIDDLINIIKYFKTKDKIEENNRYFKTKDKIEENDRLNLKAISKVIFENLRNELKSEFEKEFKDKKQDKNPDGYIAAKSNSSVIVSHSHSKSH